MYGGYIVRTCNYTTSPTSYISLTWKCLCNSRLVAMCVYRNAHTYVLPSRSHSHPTLEFVLTGSQTRKVYLHFAQDRPPCAGTRFSVPKPCPASVPLLFSVVFVDGLLLRSRDIDTFSTLRLLFIWQDPLDCVKRFRVLVLCRSCRICPTVFSLPVAQRRAWTARVNCTA